MEKKDITRNLLAGMIDHTLLKPDAVPAQIERLCAEAAASKFASVCINPWFVPMAAKLLNNSGVAVCTVVGFPLGATMAAAKAFEAQEVVEKGATEVDMVINIGALKSGDYKLVEQDIAAVAKAVKGGALLKVIIENCLLTEEEKITACKLSIEAGAQFVKTSTGMNGPGATAADVSLMRQVVGPQIGVKAAGGIRDFETAASMVLAGANRIGASASIAIIGGVAPTVDGY